MSFLRGCPQTFIYNLHCCTKQSSATYSGTQEKQALTWVPLQRCCARLDLWLAAPPFPAAVLQGVVFFPSSLCVALGERLTPRLLPLLSETLASLFGPQEPGGQFPLPESPVGSSTRASSHHGSTLEGARVPSPEQLLLSCSLASVPSPWSASEEPLDPLSRSCPPSTWPRAPAQGRGPGWPWGSAPEELGLVGAVGHPPSNKE